MGKLNHRHSTELQSTVFHQGIVQRHRLRNLRHRPQGQEQGLVLEEQEQGQESEMGQELDVVGLALVVVLVVELLHQCNQSFSELDNKQSRGVPTGMLSHRGSKNCLHSQRHLRIHLPHFLRLRILSRIAPGRTKTQCYTSIGGSPLHCFLRSCRYLDRHH